MTDVFSEEKRSFVMSRIRSQGNKDTEINLIKVFRANGIRGWRRRWPLEGRPDFVFPERRIVVFVDGCFWHGCRAHFRRPKSNVEYWDQKLCRNKMRDRIVGRTLRKKGWHVIRVWEHDLVGRRQRLCIRRIKRRLTQRCDAHQ